MNQQKLIKAIQEYKLEIGNKDIHADAGVAEREERKAYYQSWTKERIKTMNEDEFVEYIGKLWSMIVWGNKKYIANKIIETNGFENIKNMLIDLLYGTEPIEERWDKFYNSKTRLGASSMSELLSYINPNEYVICNKVTCDCFRWLEVENVPKYNYQYTGAVYKNLCGVAKQIQKEMTSNGIENVDLLIMDYMFWDVIYPIIKREGINTTTPDVVEEIPLEKDEKQFVHDDIKEQLVRIGEWLGFESKSEVKIADGAKVDVVWEAQIGNMGKVIYVFEVQTHGSIDSLILNLQKSMNNAAVQAIVAVSDEAQIEKIKREAKGIHSIETKLKTWDYLEVIEMHNCLERSNEIINNLKLVPDSFR